MKKFHLLLALATVLFCLQGGIAQIHVDADEDVGIGATSTSSAKLRIYNTNTANVYGLRTEQNAAITSGTNYGMYNYLYNAGTSYKIGFNNLVYQNSSSTNSTVGIQNDVRGYGTGTAYGYINYLQNNGTGHKYGSYNFLNQNASSSGVLYGALRYNRNYGTGATYGDYIYIYANGTGAKLGSYNYVQQASNSSNYIKGFYAYSRNNGTGYTYGFENYIHSNGTGTKYGFRSRVYQNSSGSGATAGIHNQTHTNAGGTGYGIYNKVFDAAGSTGTKYGIYNYLETDGTGTRYALYSAVAGGGNWAGYFSGNVYVSGTITEAGSDARLKNEIKDLSGSLGILAQLAPKTYTFKKDMGISLPDGQQYGLIAQDLEKVLPTLVSEVQHPGKPIIEKKMVQETILVAPEEGAEMTEDGAPQPDVEKVVEVEEEVIVGYEDGETFKTVNYKGLIPILVGAIQEQQNQIEQLKQEVQVLSKKLESVKE